jgi:gas vesicle protein
MTNEERIKECEVEIRNLKNNNIKIWNQVSNHIPTQIKNLDENNDSDHARIYDKLEANAKENREVSNKIIWYIAIGLIATTAVQILISYYK